MLRLGRRVGIVAISDVGQTNAMSDLYEWGHRCWPHFDRRPIDVADVLQEAHFQVRAALVTAICGLPVVAAVEITASLSSQEGSAP
jgi:hypothetical protein